MNDDNKLFVPAATWKTIVELYGQARLATERLFMIEPDGHWAALNTACDNFQEEVLTRIRPGLVTGTNPGLPVNMPMVPIIPMPIWHAALDLLKEVEESGKEWSKGGWVKLPGAARVSLAATTLRIMIVAHPVNLVPPEPKPPLGLKSKWLWASERKKDIVAAISRYTDAGMESPKEWLSELQDIESALFWSFKPDP